MNFKFLDNPPIWPIFFGILGGLLFNHKWSEPDTYAFFNRACLNASDFNTPIISKIFFNSIPCEQTIWFIFQAIIWIIFFYTIRYSLKKNGLDEKGLFLLCLSPFVLQLMTSFEDDFLALPIITILTYWHIRRKDIVSTITLVIFGLFLSFFIWEGAFVPLIIIAVSVIDPLLGIFVIIGLYFSGTIGKPNPEPANESRIGYGFGEYALFWFVVALFPKDWRSGLHENWDYIKVSIPLLLLAILTPKFGIYSSITLIPIAINVFTKKNYFQRAIRIGFIILLVFPILFLQISPPLENHWKLLEKGVEIQKSGQKVLNYWSVGDYFAYLGGKPSQRGGYAGFQDANGSYWIGSERKNCDTIKQAGTLYLQKC